MIKKLFILVVTVISAQGLVAITPAEMKQNLNPDGLAALTQQVPQFLNQYRPILQSIYGEYSVPVIAKYNELMKTDDVEILNGRIAEIIKMILDYKPAQELVYKIYKTDLTPYKSIINLAKGGAVLSFVANYLEQNLGFSPQESKEVAMAIYETVEWIHNLQKRVYEKHIKDRLDDVILSPTKEKIKTTIMSMLLDPAVRKVLNEAIRKIRGHENFINTKIAQYGFDATALWNIVDKISDTLDKVNDMFLFIQEPVYTIPEKRPRIQLMDLVEQKQQDGAILETTWMDV